MNDRNGSPATDSIVGTDTNSSRNPLSRKLNKLLENRLDNDKDTVEALKSLSIFFDENNLRTRRNLRGEIERRSLGINKEYVDAFKMMKDKLDEVYEDVSCMNQCCNDMTQKLKSVKAQTNNLIGQTTNLRSEGQSVRMKREISRSFLRTFQLTAEETKILRGKREGDLDDRFFAVLERIKMIHDDCKVLLRTKQQTAGLEIMEMMAMHEEAAYERLYRWTQGECRMQNMECTDASNMLCNAMKSLKERPVLFNYSLEEFATARRAAVVRSFIDALTRGGPGGIPRPMELHSHDPIRYCGDMLAWVHQSSASERECLLGLLRLCGDYQGKDDDIKRSLSNIMDGICRPLKIRLEQVIVSEPGVVTTYKLSNLFKFYHRTIGPKLSDDSSLVGTLHELHALARKMFVNSLVLSTTKLVEKVQAPSTDLVATEAANQLLVTMKEVLASHESAVVSMDDKQKDYAQIMNCTVDPLLQMCHMSASKLSPPDMATYLINCLHVVHSTVALYEFVDDRLEMFQEEINAHLDTLTNEQASYVVSQVSLGTIYKTVLENQSKKENKRMRDLPGMDAIAIKAAMKNFDEYLSSPDTLVLPQANLITSRSLRQNLRTKSLQLVHSCYSMVYDAVTDPQSGYDEPKNLMHRTPQQVKTLLCI